LYRALIACLLALAGGASSAHDAVLGQVMRLLSEVKASTVRFSEKKTMAALAGPLMLSGRLSYVRGGPITKEVETPYRERTTIEGDTMTVESPARGDARSYSLRASPAAWAFAEGLRATLGGDLVTLERYYRISFSGGVDDWSLGLAPQEEEMARYVRSIGFRGRSADITQITVDEAGGNSSLMTIRPDSP
jgi:Outer membrane lipoprotein carrier protein LolA-like